MADNTHKDRDQSRPIWRRGWFQIMLGLVVVGLIAGTVLVWRLSRQVSLVGFRSGGGRAQVETQAGFTIDVYAEGLEGPRFISFGPDGGLFVAERGAGRILRLADQDGDGRADSRQVFADDLNAPHSVVHHQGAWYVGVPTGVVKLEDHDGDGQAEARQAIIESYPTGGHNTRTVLFLPDGRMVVSIGSSCNVCLEDDPRRAAIVSYQEADGQGEQVFASGLRNAVGLAIQPATGQLWATNNGRDFLGDDQPPDTLIQVKEGQNYGWPRCHSGRIIDPEFGNEGDCQGIPDPALEIQAHSAPLGLTFYNGSQFPAEFQGDLFIAYHGSWNRSVPTGYKVVRVPFENGQPAGDAQDFAWGWLEFDPTQVTGRPVGLAVGPKGSLFVSDDSKGFIYRISFEG
jgi:glucose/arabinose dehydrogenase